MEIHLFFCMPCSGLARIGRLPDQKEINAHKETPIFPSTVLSTL